MKIALLSDASVVHTRRWGDALAELGHEIELLSLEPGEGFPYPFHHVRSRLPLRFLRYPMSTTIVRRWLERFQPDVVNAHFVPNYGLIGVLAGVRPLVTSVWGSDVLISGTKSLLHRSRARFVLERSDAITTDAAMLTRAVIELGGAADKVLTVPMGVDLAAYRAAAATRVGRPTQATIVSTRKLEPVYNVDLLIDAIPAVRREQPEARFVIVGDGPLRERYESSVGEHAGVVEFRGMIPHADMAGTLADADVYVSTSLSDSTSVSLLEAMAAGCFPVVTDIEANHEWIEHGVNGFLVPVDDPAQLAERIHAALADPALRERARRQNDALIEKRADWHDNMRAVEALLEQQVGEFRGRTG